MLVKHMILRQKDCLQAIRVMLLLLIAVSSNAFAQAQALESAGKAQVPESAGKALVPESAGKVLTAAREVAVAEHKNIFVLFHASWCGWCHKMDSAMNDPQIKKYFDGNYVVRHLVVMESKDKKALENPGALELMKKYSDESSGIPFWIVYDTTGALLFDSRAVDAEGKRGDNVGCPASEKEVDHFIRVLKGSSGINEEGLLAIRKRFRKIETGL